MADAFRVALRTVTIAVLGMIGWLVIVIVAVLPARDPGSIGLWSLVAAGAGMLAALALLVTMRPGRPDRALRAAFAVLCLIGLAFGVMVLVATAIRREGHFEGYLLLVGAILAAEGAFGIGWLLTANRVGRASRS